MEMSRLVTFYSNNFENNPVIFYQGCVSHKSQKDDLNNVTKLVVSQVLMIGCSHVFFISSVQSFSCVRLFATPWTAERRLPCPSPTPGANPNSCASSRWCHPAISSSVIPFSSCSKSLPSIMVFSNESTLRMRWPKYWSFSFKISPSNEYSGLISFRIYWLDLLAVQGTLKSLLQHHSSKASILWCKS